jgi:hypothetical protein
MVWKNFDSKMTYKRGLVMSGFPSEIRDGVNLSSMPTSHVDELLRRLTTDPPELSFRKMGDKEWEAYRKAHHATANDKNSTHPETSPIDGGVPVKPSPRTPLDDATLGPAANLGPFYFTTGTVNNSANVNDIWMEPNISDMEGIDDLIKSLPPPEVMEANSHLFNFADFANSQFI